MADITYTTQAALVAAGAPTGESAVSTLARGLVTSDGVQIPAGFTALTTLSNLTPGTALTIPVNAMSKNINAKFTLITAAACTITISGAVAGSRGRLYITQPAASTAGTIVLPTGSKVASGGGGAVTLSSTNGYTDILDFDYDGTNYWWTLVGVHFT